ncbi:MULTISPECIES: arsenate reductase/protein-tyrosine-phosphatase family protein [unclassified Microbacterium]|uniref:arsenate reductase/protein-tyrosine-phosphatase family protein n=1 Tax=unclassified Microbacterium TaxID=2609290 RepID=UPI0025FC9EDD|nr:low molecular weight phosphatase family protein [Microbacterium sp.]
MSEEGHGGTRDGGGPMRPRTRRELRAAREAAHAEAARAAAPRPVKRLRNRTPVIAPDPMPQGAPTILTVCTGNICRSPLAEVLLRTRLEEFGVRVHSAGTHALVGAGMPEEAQAVALARHARPADVAAHRGRRLREQMLLESDLVLTMTQEQRGFAVQLVPSRLHRIFPAREFARAASGLPDAEVRRLAATGGDDPRARLGAVIMAIAGRRGSISDDDDVLDPYRLGSAAYETSAAQLDPALAEVERVVQAALGRTAE